MRHAAVRVGNAVASIAFFAFVASAVLMITLWLHAWVGWWSWLGLPLAVLSAPLAFFYPFVVWAVEGALPDRAVVVWMLGMAGALTCLLWMWLGRSWLGDRGDEAPPELFRVGHRG